MYLHETWKSVEGYPYQVSSHGRIRRVFNDKKRPPYLLSLILGSTGYYQVTLWDGKTGKTRKLHQIICEAFHGAKPSPHHHVAHFDNNRINNSADNLRWATAIENASDGVRDGTHLGSNNGFAKLTEKDVLEIKQQISSGDHSLKEIAAIFGVHPNTISAIKSGRNWGWM